MLDEIFDEIINKITSSASEFDSEIELFDNDILSDNINFDGIDNSEMNVDDLVGIEEFESNNENLFNVETCSQDKSWEETVSLCGNYELIDIDADLNEVFSDADNQVTCFFGESKPYQNASNDLEDIFEETNISFTGDPRKDIEGKIESLKGELKDASHDFDYYRNQIEHFNDKTTDTYRRTCQSHLKTASSQIKEISGKIKDLESKLKNLN